MSVETIVIIVVVAAAAGFGIRRLWKVLSGKVGGCANCHGCNYCKKPDEEG